MNRVEQLQAMDYGQEQADEIEALESIYTGLFDKLSEVPPYTVAICPACFWLLSFAVCACVRARTLCVCVRVRLCLGRVHVWV